MKTLLHTLTLSLLAIMACGQTSSADPAPAGFNCTNGWTVPQGGFTNASLSYGTPSGYVGCAINVDGQLVCWTLQACN